MKKGTKSGKAYCRKMVDEKIASAYAKLLIKNEGLRVEAKQVLDEICTCLKCKVNVEHSNGFSVNPEGRSYGVALLAGVIFSTHRVDLEERLC